MLSHLHCILCCTHTRRIQVCWCRKHVHGKESEPHIHQCLQVENCIRKKNQHTVHINILEVVPEKCDCYSHHRHLACTVCQMKHTTVLKHLPVHTTPSPLYPVLHAHVKDPSVLVQEALAWQGDSATHSLMSAGGRIHNTLLLALWLCRILISSYYWDKRYKC